MEDIPNREEEIVGVEYWRKILESVFQDKKVIVAGEIAAGLLPRTRQVRQLGALTTFMLATDGVGASDVPAEDSGEWFAIGAPDPSNLVKAIHNGQRLLGDLPPRAIAALDRYDPSSEAIVVGGFFHEQPEVAGRKSLSYRRPEWLALDDKTVIDRVWDEMGIPRERSEVVDVVDKEKILAAMRRLNMGDGVVLSGDSRDGVSSSAIGTRWVHSESDIDSVLNYYSKNCDRLRVMP